MVSSRLNLTAIDASLSAVQADFDRINRSLSTPRDAMTDEVRGNMMAGYGFVDDALAGRLDLFALGNSKWLLELNTLVLCGGDEGKRAEFAGHIASSERRFYEQKGGGVGALMEWLKWHQGDDVWRRAAGAYVFVLSRPELYIEGNHRTGALLMSYMLAREGQPPFVLSVHNARAYFEPSTLVKETRNHSLSMLIRLPRLRLRLAKLLEQTAGARHLLPAEQSRQGR